ncbi:methyl-accepting chemotaxis protein [Aliivibrio fischeri]|uniref:methyl-accepting chemotaxis protein n=1 Tax=Aliivibrio fischeri TaxID=668 RepID=UPI0012DA543D|nr:methyl-accepting chemotaxis protein [Aliivibrio fischeri]MUL09024.1 HAMP domain-containing protein [Aliivibrio fischeri]MUL15155.1 HAMP domain-containing protein [Aliivibrio fischeri]
MTFNLKNISIRFQVLLPVILSVLLLLITLNITNSILEKQNSSVNSYTDDFIFYQKKISDIDNIIFPLRINAIYAIHDDTRREQFRNSLPSADELINQHLTDLEKNIAFSNDVKNAKIRINEYLKYSYSVMNSLESKDESVDSLSEFNNLVSKYRQSGNKAIRALDTLATNINTYSNAKIHDSYEQNTQVKKQAAIIVFIVFIVSLSVAWWLSGLIVNPIQQIQLIIRRLAEGDLTVRANADGKNEIAILSQDINTTASQLQTTVEALSRISEDVAAASTELAAVMTEAENNSQQELSEIEQVASAVNELSSTADNVSNNALAADKSARETNTLARNGLEIFTQSNKASEEMSSALTDAALVVNRLKEQSEQINNVVEVIRGVSDQTNLLALNAAIEAARAGESGRGFAVVADEVRMLAARTQDSTQEIQTIIESLQEQSTLANASMESSLDKLELNKELTAKASDALLQITNSITSINDMNAQVATAAEEQSQVTQDINRNVVNMSELVNQNVTGISQSASASNELSKLAERQKEQLSFFKL